MIDTSKYPYVHLLYFIGHMQSLHLLRNLHTHTHDYIHIRLHTSTYTVNQCLNIHTGILLNYSDYCILGDKYFIDPQSTFTPTNASNFTYTYLHIHTISPFHIHTHAGILLNYSDDCNLGDKYFIDPQWLCDILANVVTIREVNCLVRNGL